MYNKSDKSYLNNHNYSMALEKFYIAQYYKEKYSGENYTLDRVYPSSNEELDLSFEHYGTLENARVLTVGSSGDQLLSSIYRGARDVTLIDGNPYARYFVEYKIALINNLTLDEYIKFFDCSYRHGKIFDHKVYSRIFHSLSSDAQSFWGNIFSLGLPSYDIANRMMHDYTNFKLEYLKNDDTFQHLKDCLNSSKIKYVTADLTDFHNNIDGKYDLILLSNIGEYFDTSSELRKKFKLEVDILYHRHLKNGGKMQVYYTFDSLSTSGQIVDHIKHKYQKFDLSKRGLFMPFVNSTYVITKPTICLREEKEL